MTRCAQLPTLLRLRDEGEQAQIDAHLEGCADCAAEWADLAALTTMGRALPEAPPEAARVESVRTQILARAAAPARPPRRLWWLAAAAVVLAGLGVWQLMPVAGPQRAGTIQVDSGARYEVRRIGGDEIVELREGRIDIEVAELSSGQRFLVVTADAEVEVRGTRFAVVALGGRLERVEVESGVVVVRPQAGETVRLEASQRWVRSAPSEPAAPEVSPDAAPPPPAEPPVAPVAPSRAPRRPRPKAVKPDAAPPPPKPPTVTPQTQGFEAGWAALRAGRLDAAIDAFGAAAALPGPLQEDASWWQAVALGRSGQDARTRKALDAFLARFPRSSRGAEAAVMIGWMDFSAGRIDAAERGFRRGTKARRAAVRTQAEEGLRAVAKWRAEAR